MSGLLQRYSSYSSSGGGGGASHHVRPSPSTRSETRPIDPFPRGVNSLKPSDVLINRCHQLKRFAKHLSLYFQALSQSHHAHSLTLLKLPSHIPTPIAEASIFLPSSPPSTNPNDSSTSTTEEGGEVAPLGGTGQEGWAQIFEEIKQTNQQIAQNHQDLSKLLIKQVVGPLNKVKEEIKGFLNQMEKDVQRLCDQVQKERDLTLPLVQKLESCLKLESIRPLYSDDPLLVRAQLEAQLVQQLKKENELLLAVKQWTEKVEQREKELFIELQQCWKLYSSGNSNMLLGNQQLTMFLSATVDSVPPESEWNHFLKLNHSIPLDLPSKTLKDLPEWKTEQEGEGGGTSRIHDDRCNKVLAEGSLERQTSFLKSWKLAYFILTPTGHFLLYPPPTTASSSSSSPASSSSRSQSTNLSVPIPPPTHHSISANDPSSSASSSSASEEIDPDSNSLSTISPTAFQLLTNSQPILTLYLPNSSLGPMPTPEHHSPSTQTQDDVVVTEKVQKKKNANGALDAVFTLIENQGKGTKHILRAVPPTPPTTKSVGEGEVEERLATTTTTTGDEWELMGKWIKEISKFTLPAPPSPQLPSVPNFTSSSPPLPQIPSPPLPSDLAGSSPSHSEKLVPTPASSSIFGGFFGGGGGGGGTRSSVASSTANSSNTSKSLSSTSTTDATTEDDEEDVDTEVELGSSGPPPLPPRDREFSNNSSFNGGGHFQGTPLGEGESDATPITIIEDQSHSSTDEEDRGDLGRSLSPPPPPVVRRAVPPLPPTRSNSSGRVANLAKAFDQEVVAQQQQTKSPKSDHNDNNEETKEGEGKEGETVAVENGNATAMTTKGGKKNKKKNKNNKGGRKSNQQEQEEEDGGDISTAATTNEEEEEEDNNNDLSLASPPLDLGNSEIDFDQEVDESSHLNLSHLKLDDNNINNNEDQEGDISGEVGEMSFDETKLEREFGLSENEGDVKSPPPMVLEEVEEGPTNERDDEGKDEKDNKD